MTLIDIGARRSGIGLETGSGSHDKKDLSPRPGKWKQVVLTGSTLR
jgi:hypothetical protein